MECVVVGAGVIGLAIARSLSQSGMDLIIMESNNAIGTETSSRNSEVIHAGIYYSHNSLKARACVQGRQMLYEFCQSHSVPFKQCGKLIVANTELQKQELSILRQKALRNGVSDIVEMTALEVSHLEPDIHCLGALFSPSTGIIDSHSLMLAYLGDAEAAGAMLALNCSLKKVIYTGQDFELYTDQIKIKTNILINSTGLHASHVAAMIEGFPEDKIPKTYFAKGNYYSLSGASPFKHLIYPVPEPGGLGVHLTLDLAGQVRFGPDVEWVDQINYNVDPKRADSFYSSVRHYWPSLPDHALQPSYSGIRPKLSGPNGAATDFIIQGANDHGIPGLVNLFGIESPGLTSSLYLAEKVAKLV
ncbi:NAD(P)/FAD-dependent oxidoreductase [Legionella shakespearei]|uniref:NAD(P)/FAD-dependent oxidoreductase n=1 Tax=Legionella shakespearei TaxID=45075 RepID=UPI001ED99882|nr:NAD(P)/FAD-dependent oxidoreductase [Legionella shakespearei]